MIVVGIGFTNKTENGLVHVDSDLFIKQPTLGQKVILYTYIREEPKRAKREAQPLEEDSQCRDCYL